MADFVIKNLRGGMNNSDPAIGLPDDQCVEGTNVEFVESLLGERRRGTTAVTVTGSDIDGKDRVTFLARHLPSADLTAAELWAWGFKDSPASNALCRKTTAWSTVTVSDAITTTGFFPYLIQAVSFGGKHFITYKSSVNRLHVWDGTSFRRTGVAEPAAPTGANQGAGTLTGRRYYRVRYTEKSGSTTLRRSEPSDTLTFDPNGTSASVRVTKPAAISEGETHWELEASTDNANFYVIATTTVGTTTYDDSQDYTTGYAQSFTLSEAVGAYTLQESYRYLCADGDRILGGGSYETDAYKSRVSWGVVSGAPGVGNDERTDENTDPFKDLDKGENGELTGMISGGFGAVYVFKTSAVYKLVRSGLRLRAYDDVTITKERGALHGSVCRGVDEKGNSCIYFLDQAVGPCRIVRGVVEQCGSDVRETWATVNLEATKVVCSACYYPETRQVIWNIATDANNIPSLSVVLHTNEVRTREDGAHRGAVQWNGNRAKALTMCLFSDNINDNAARSRTLVPFIGLEGLGLIHRCDTGNDDNGVTYSARIVTKPYVLGNLIHKFGIKMGALLAKAVTGAKIDLTIMGTTHDAYDEVEISNITFDAVDGEPNTIKLLDNLSMSELRMVQFEFEDSAVAGTRFELHQLALLERKEQRGGN